jgi:hypothetical protein
MPFDYKNGLYFCPNCKYGWVIDKRILTCKNCDHEREKPDFEKLKKEYKSPFEN